MDLLECACDIPYEDEDKPRFFEDTRQIQCPLCLASTPPWETHDQAVRAWNAMQQAMRAQDAEQGEAMTVQIPVVVMVRGPERWVSVPWFDPRPSPMSDPPARVALAALTNALAAGAQQGGAYVVTATLPVPQPPQVIRGTAVTVGAQDGGDHG